MEIITLTKDNLEKEHICCAISNNKDFQVASKKQWLSKRFDDGLVILSSKKKLPFLSDPKFLRYKGFLLADTAEPSYELQYLPLEENALKPRFKDRVKTPKISEPGFVLYYTNQCPFTAKYVPLIENVAKQKGIEFKSIHFETAEQAQNVSAPFTTYSLFYKGEFLTNEILSEKKFEKILTEKGL